MFNFTMEVNALLMPFHAVFVFILVFNFVCVVVATGMWM